MRGKSLVVPMLGDNISGSKMHDSLGVGSAAHAKKKIYLIHAYLMRDLFALGVVDATFPRCLDDQANRRNRRIAALTVGFQFR